ncbi:HAD family hydrolase [Anaerobacillus alkaliphilus]|uniref:HAD family hydrolase n=1 Tax=Anaerobacillus alkaliphilus TaxID=1548597 RepID=A0A4Q0VPN8_9BACI|nr:HAD family hydrolase [Anaerobacillus alkaliphilus]RXI98373.1 HAD family hydrolase [Anaerobacillus alkaliphilus]
MTNYKAIVLDLDGTLLKKDETISSQNKEFLLEQKEQGVKVILATGRPINMTLQYHQELQLDTPIISLNGAVIFDRQEQKVVQQSIITPKEVEHAFEKVSDSAQVMISHTSKANYQMINLVGNYITENWPVEPTGAVPAPYEPILKLSVHFKDVSSASDALALLLARFEIANWGDSFEMTKKSVTKWHALQTVLHYFQILPEEVVAFGDGPNDVEMLKNVGTGVAMENGRFMAKKVAKYITTHHDQDGVAEFFKMNRKSLQIV